MNDAVPDHSAGGAADSAKLIAAVVLLLAGIVAFYALHAQPDWQRWLAVVAGVVLAILVFGASQRGQASSSSSWSNRGSSCARWSGRRARRPS